MFVTENKEANQTNKIEGRLIQQQTIVCMIMILKPTKKIVFPFLGIIYVFVLFYKKKESRFLNFVVQ